MRACVLACERACVRACVCVCVCVSVCVCEISVCNFCISLLCIVVLSGVGTGGVGVVVYFIWPECLLVILAFESLHVHVCTVSYIWRCEDARFCV